MRYFAGDEIQKPRFLLRRVGQGRIRRSETRPGSRSFQAISSGIENVVETVLWRRVDLLFT